MPAEGKAGERLSNLPASAGRLEGIVGAHRREQQARGLVAHLRLPRAVQSRSACCTPPDSKPHAMLTIDVERSSSQSMAIIHSNLHAVRFDNVQRQPKNQTNPKNKPR